MLPYLAPAVVASQIWPLHGKQGQRLGKHKPLALTHRRRARCSMVAVSVVLGLALEAFPLEAAEASPAMVLPMAATKTSVAAS